MSRIAKKLVDLIGNTPLLELSNYNKFKGLQCNIIAKLEYFNPARSIKDRIGYAMIKDAEDKGLINKDSVIIEPTSGNTGIALAFVAASKGYKLILTMPETMSVERRNLLKALGAEVILTSETQGIMGAIKKAEELAMQIPNSFIPDQFKNPINPSMHNQTTGEEIWRDTDGNVDIFVGGIGTGGTVIGAGEFLKGKKKNISIVAVRPFELPYLSGNSKGLYKIEGLGSNPISDTFDFNVVDEIYKVKPDDAFETSRELARTEGLLVGKSSGAIVFAAAEISKRPENKGKNIVVVLPDTGERYLSTLLFSHLRIIK